MLFKEFAGVDAFPICLDTTRPRRDRRRRQGDRARLRRHQPRGHLGAALLRDRGPAQGRARHPGVPRRPARHRGRGAGGAAERADADRPADRRHPGRDRRAWAPPGSRWPRSCWRPARATSSAATRAGAVHVERGRLPGRHDAARSSARWPSAPTPSGAAGGAGRGARGRRPVHRPVGGRGCSRRRRWPAMNPDPIVFAMANPTPEVIARGGRCRTRGSSPPAARTTPTRSTTCSASRASSAARSTSARPQITEAMKTAAARAIADIVVDDELREDYIIPSVFNREVVGRGGGGGGRGGARERHRRGRGRDRVRRDRGIRDDPEPMRCLARALVGFGLRRLR